MSSIGEELLLKLSHVKSKKNGLGTLYLFRTRLLWGPSKDQNSSDAASVISLKYEDVKVQKISPEGKHKVQLQVSMLDGSASTFHFTNPDGYEAQLTDRENVKEMLQQLLPRFKAGGGQSELERKERLLQSNPELFQMYKELVPTKIVSAEEFWANYAAQATTSNGQTFNTESQSPGTSSGFFAGITQLDGCNRLKFNITADTIEAIFKTYPAVKRKHLEKVPHELSEEAFWTQFFQSHYFHRDRVVTPMPKEIFSECIKSDEEYLQNRLKTGASDDFDLRKLIEQPVEVEGYGNKRIDEVDGPSTSSAAPTSKTAINQMLVRRFNYHSSRVLDSFSATLQPDGTSSDGSTTNNKAISALIKGSHHGSGGSPAVKNGAIYCNSGTSNGDTLLTGGPPLKKSKYAVVECTELLGESHASRKEVALALHVPHKNHVLKDRRSPETSSLKLNINNCRLKLESELAALNKRIESDDKTLQSNTYAESAHSHIAEFSPGRRLTLVSEMTINEKVPASVRQELNTLYAICTELLRHFWSAFPVTTPELETKVQNMHETLRKFESAKLLPFAQQLELIRPPLPKNLLEHLRSMLKTAFNKYDAWASRRTGVIASSVRPSALQNGNGIS